MNRETGVWFSRVCFVRPNTRGRFTFSLGASRKSGGGGRRRSVQNDGAMGDDDTFSGLRVSAPNGVKVYQVTGGKQVPKWLSETNKRKLRKDADYQRRIELVQDLEFSTASSRVRLSGDGNFLAVTGIHPPQVKVYDLSQLSMKFERHLDAEVVDFDILSDDYSKMAFLCADRSVVFHAKFGNYYKTRFPRQGRAIAYAEHTGDLVVVGSTHEVYRLNLEQGRFLSPLETNATGVNCARVSSTHGLLACGSENGTVECFDLRSRERLGGGLRVCAGGAEGSGDGVTSVRFEPSGMRLATGDAEGKVRLYDLRSSRPLFTKDHMNGFKMVDVRWHGASDGHKRIISADTRVVRAWEPDTGRTYTSVEPGDEINDVCVWDGTGLIVTAMETRRLGVHFVPSLGAAPSWCSFLENITEEMEEEAAPSIYDDYKFVTREELTRLGMDNLIGTNMLRAYMHGFFVDNRLYGKAKAIAEPFSYEEYKQKKVEEKLAQELATRIVVKRKAPKVNAALVARLEKGETAADRKRKGRKKGGADTHEDTDDEDEGADAILKDDRFARMFEDADFEVDEDDDAYRALHPNAPKLSKREREEMLEEHFDLDEDDDDDENEGAAAEDGPGELDDDDDDGGDGDDGDGDGPEPEPRARRSGSDGVKMYTVKDERHAAAFREGRRAPPSDLPLARRVALEGGDGAGRKTRMGGNKELVFDPSSRSRRDRARTREREMRDGAGGAAEEAWVKGGGADKKKQKKRGMGGLLPKQRGGGRGRR